jgi:hypothetical protein
VTQCARCARDIPGSGSACDACGAQAAEPVAPPVVLSSEPGLQPVTTPTAAAPLEQISPAVEDRLPAAAAAGFSRRELLAIAIAIALGGSVTFGMLAASGARPSDPAPSAGVPERSRTQSIPVAAPRRHWNSTNRDWIGNDRRAIAFELMAENKVQVWQRIAQPILVVRCLEKRTETFVFIESAAQIEAQANHAVRVRVDDEPEREERWPDTEEHDALVAPDSAAFTHRLIGARTLRFGYKPHNSAPVVAEFNVDGLGTLIEPLAAQCGWTR